MQTALRVRVVAWGRRPDGGVFIGRILEFDDAKGEPVDEQDNVRAPLVAVLDDGELVDREPVVGRRVVEVDHLSLGTADRAVDVMLHGHTIDEHAVERSVAGLQGGAFGAGQFPIRVVQDACREVWIEAGERIAESRREDNFAVALSLGPGLIGRNARSVGDAPIKTVKPVEGSVLCRCFIDAARMIVGGAHEVSADGYRRR